MPWCAATVEDIHMKCIKITRNSIAIGIWYYGWHSYVLRTYSNVLLSIPFISRFGEWHKKQETRKNIYFYEVYRANTISGKAKIILFALLLKAYLLFCPPFCSSRSLSPSYALSLSLSDSISPNSFPSSARSRCLYFLSCFLQLLSAFFCAAWRKLCFRVILMRYRATCIFTKSSPSIGIQYIEVKTTFLGNEATRRLEHWKYSIPIEVIMWMNIERAYNVLKINCHKIAIACNRENDELFQ